MGSTEELTGNSTKPISLYDAALPTSPLLFKSTYPSPSIEEPAQPDPSESDPIQITFNSGPRPFKDLPFLFLFLFSVLCTFAFGIFSIFHRNDNYSAFQPLPTILIPLLAFKTLSFHQTQYGSFKIVYLLLPFFVIVPIFFDVYWFVACTVSSSCSDTFPLVYRILVLVFVLPGVGVIVWIIVANWHRIELTVRIIGVASDALSRNLGLFLVIPLLTVGLVIYYAPTVVFLVFSRFNGKIVAKESNGEYTCVWKQDSWVPAYFTLAILTMLWSLTTMVEARVYVISGTIAQWYFSKDDEKPHLSIRRSLRNAFGPSSGTICLSGLLICVVRVVHTVVDSAREEDVPGMVNLVLRCCVNTLLSAIEFLNKFTINFAAITGEAYCTSARMTYELLRRNLLSAAFVETVSTRLLAGVILVFSSVYAIVACAILKGVTDLGDNAYIVAVLAMVLLIAVLGFFVCVLDNVIDAVYICYAIDRDRGEVYKQECFCEGYNFLIAMAVLTGDGEGSVTAAGVSDFDFGVDCYYACFISVETVTGSDQDRIVFPGKVHWQMDIHK
ncbi:hypothetical protein F3Y22_tig00008386pilonHSYRG00018 [Hibiscus syriacus]|uniref:Choline transporter-like protein n=1 Tax=Hibiscus syriacus TaxID=106335 RepID=A0A6A3CCW0_HIBSY|nr:hypothetical protein F3Y22_tig00008386pilonHSYRG00018 [Hibiscus syriacus]